MTLARKRSLELVRLLLEDAAADPALNVGSRERLTIMAARVGTEMEVIETLSPTPADDIPQAVKGRDDRNRTLSKVECAPGFSKHRWDGAGRRCSRCGVFR